MTTDATTTAPAWIEQLVPQAHRDEGERLVKEVIEWRLSALPLLARCRAFFDADTLLSQEACEQLVAAATGPDAWRATDALGLVIGELGHGTELNRVLASSGVDPDSLPTAGQGGGEQTS